MKRLMKKTLKWINQKDAEIKEDFRNMEHVKWEQS
jgi:hypothetical protein